MADLTAAQARGAVLVLAAVLVLVLVLVLDTPRRRQSIAHPLAQEEGLHAASA